MSRSGDIVIPLFSVVGIMKKVNFGLFLFSFPIDAPFIADFVYWFDLVLSVDFSEPASYSVS